MQPKNLVKLILLSTLIALSFSLVTSCNSGSENSSPMPINEEQLIDNNASYPVNVVAPETGSAIYLNGVYTGKNTPATLSLSQGTHIIGVGLANSRHYLKRNIEVQSQASSIDINLDFSDQQIAKVWKALFIGINKVTNAQNSCVSEYTEQELDLAFEFFNWSFKEKVTDYSYNTTRWQTERRDITNEIIELNHENLITPEIIDKYITDIKPGNYDLIVTFFRGGQGADTDCFIDNFIGIAWYDVTELNSDASYFTIRYYDDVKGKIDESINGDAGLFIHEWLHTTAEMFYPTLGSNVPKDNGQVVHAASKFGYDYPWVSWYKDLISGQIKGKDNYLGIGPEALLACTVREKAVSECT